MKRILFSLAALAVLAPAVLFADGLTLNAGVTAWGVDAAAVNNAAVYPAIIPAFNLGYGMKTDGLALKFGLAAEDALINYSGLSWGSTASKNAQTAEFITVGRGEPYAELNMGALSIHVGLPLYYFTPNSPSGDQNGPRNALKWMYKGVGLQYYSTGATDFVTANNALFTNYDTISYKIVVTQQFSIVPVVQCDFIFSPAVATADIKPAVAFNYGPVALNAQASYYPIAEGQGIKITTSSGIVYNTYVLTIDPKLTVSFDSLGVKGLKAFASASIPVKTEYYYNKGLNVIPGLSYSLGALSLEADLKMNYLDYAGSDGTNYKQPEYDPYVKLFYTLKL
ncbi:MAG: hypothetical protein ABSF43_08775 [Rectinemataceae bacterium]|jgi:hypothetical protein